MHDAVAFNPRRKREPFARLEQRELAYLRAVGCSASEVLLLVVLRVRVNGRTGVVGDRVVSLTSWSGLGRTAVKAALASLQRRRLIAREKVPTKGDRSSTW